MLKPRTGVLLLIALKIFLNIFLTILIGSQYKYSATVKFKNILFSSGGKITHTISRNIISAHAHLSTHIYVCTEMCVRTCNIHTYMYVLKYV